MAVFLAQRWRRLPTARMEVDRNHPLARNIIAAMIPVHAGYVDPVTPSSSLIIGGSARVESGVLKLASSVSTYGKLTAIEGAAKASFFSRTYIRARSMRGGLWGKTGGGTNFGVGCGYSSPEAVFAYIGDGGGFIAQGLGSSDYFVNGEEAAFCFTYDTGAGIFYKNGLSQHSGSSGTAIATSDTGVDFGFGNSLSGGSLDADHKVFFAWTRALSSAEVWEISQNPYQLLRSQQRKLYVFVSGGGTTHNVSVAESGTAADSVSSSAVLAGSLSETGTAADTPSAIMTTAASLTETGNAQDAVDFQGGIPASVAETGAAADSVSAIAARVATVAEVGVAADTVTVTQITSASLVEAGAAVDQVSIPSINAAVLAEVAFAVDLFSVVHELAPGTWVREASIANPWTPEDSLTNTWIPEDSL